MQKERLQVANLTVIEKFYIEANTEMSSDEIANIMRSAVTVEDVQKHRDSIPATDPTKNTAGDAMAIDSEKGVAIMTQTAAELADESVKSDPELQENLNSNKIFRIK